MICLVPPETAAAAPPHFGYGGPRDDQPPSLPLAYLPRGLDNSSGSQVTVPDDRWGPLRGQMIHFSSGQGSHFLVLRDEVAGQPQGAVVPLVGEFRSGAHRGKFNPRDGQLYVSGLAGWGSYTPDDGCFQRVRYTGEPVQLPRSFHLHENGVLISFTRPVDLEQISQLSNHFAQVWNYRYGPGYGSPEFAPSHPGAVGHEVLRIAGVHVIDPTTDLCRTPRSPASESIAFVVASRRGSAAGVVHHGPSARQTVHAVSRLSADAKRSWPPIRCPSIWRSSARRFRIRGKGNSPAVTPLKLAAGKNLTFSTRTLRAKAGELLSLTFNNPDVVPHNWVLIKPDSLARVGDLANKLVADPEAVLHQYVPRRDDVLVYTDIVPPQQQFTIYFRAPQETGRYPYLCTFPGHWMVMNGELVIE